MLKHQGWLFEMRSMVILTGCLPGGTKCRRGAIGSMPPHHKTVLRHAGSRQDPVRTFGIGLATSASVLRIRLRRIDSGCRFKLSDVALKLWLSWIAGWSNW